MIRLAGYDPIKVKEIYQWCTYSEIAEVHAIQALDHSTEDS